jgi:hypothetical protein
MVTVGQFDNFLAGQPSTIWFWREISIRLAEWLSLVLTGQFSNFLAGQLNLVLTGHCNMGVASKYGSDWATLLVWSRQGTTR